MDEARDRDEEEDPAGEARRKGWAAPPGAVCRPAEGEGEGDQGVHLDREVVQDRERGSPKLRSIARPVTADAHTRVR
ncbi:hypothetical protein ACTU45_08495 [Streptomyces sp. 24-1644]|uniref:hypothetical protein n=1 Tax=Streptomyces sp. 24-1644 TaxID=3457315 RepID=UPI003FA7EBE8